GQHTVQFRATDKVGNVSAFTPFTFTLDTMPPAVNFQLAPSPNLLPQTVGHTRQGTATLVGSTSPNLSVTLQQTGAHTMADAAGGFSFTNVPLAPGDNPFTVTATDALGNVGTASHTITRDVNVLTEGSNFTVPFQLPFTVPQQAAELQLSFDSLQ